MFGATTPAVNGTAKSYRVQLTDKQKEKFQQAIRNAKSMAEIARLEKDFNEGKIPAWLLDDTMDTS